MRYDNISQGLGFSGLEKRVMKLALFLLIITALPDRPPAKTPIYVFAPVPKGGCPAGYYEVRNAVFTGLDWHAACWSRRLNRIENDHEQLKMRN